MNDTYRLSELIDKLQDMQVAVGDVDTDIERVILGKYNYGQRRLVRVVPRRPEELEDDE